MALGVPPRGGHISTQGGNFKNRFYGSLPTTTTVIHAKFGGVWSLNPGEIDTGFDFHPGQLKKRGNLYFPTQRCSRWYEMHESPALQRGQSWVVDPLTNLLYTTSFSPMCFRKCLFKVQATRKLAEHSLHLNGQSLLCMRSWISKLLRLLKLDGQTLHL